MKKIVWGFLMVCCSFLLVGCGSNDLEEKLTTCTLSQDVEAQSYRLDATYTIYSKGNYVTKVETKEVVTSDEKSILEYYENFATQTYEAMNKQYGGYTYNATMNDTNITIDTTIDYSKMNLEQFSKDNAAISSYLKDNKMLLDGVKSIYEQLGATCN